MARVHLTLDDKLFELLKNEADERSIAVNAHILSLLVALKMPQLFDYGDALSQLIKEALSKQENEEFTLVDLPLFKSISVARAEDGNIKPSIVRARLGKMFNAAVQKAKIDGIRRSKENGELKFKNKAAVYMRTTV